MNSGRLSLLALACAAMLAAAGCSISYSIGSISDSVSGSVGSSSSSSGGGSSQDYQEDVRDYTATFVRSNADQASFDRGVASLAKQHGVSDWENDRATWRGIGEGLAKAKLSAGEAEHYKQQFAGGDEQRQKWIQQAYENPKSF